MTPPDTAASAQTDASAKRRKGDESLWESLLIAYGAGALLHQAIWAASPYWLPVFDAFFHLRPPA